MGLFSRFSRLWQKHAWAHTLALVVLIFARSFDQTLYYRLATNYGKYSWYFAFVAMPLGFLLVSWPVVFFRLRHGSVRLTALRGSQRLYLLLGLLDALGVVMTTMPIPVIGGMTANVLSQLVLPINVLLSFLILKTRFKEVHIIGCILAVYGSMIRLIPAMTSAHGAPHGATHNGTNALAGPAQLGASVAGDTTDNRESSGPVFWAWTFVMIGAQLPLALSNVLKERGLKLNDLDVWIMNAFVSTYQLLWAIILVPIVVLPVGAGTPRSMDELGTSMRDATLCFVGQLQDRPDEAYDNCHENPGLLVVYLVLNVTYNVLMLFVFKLGSSVLYVITATTRMPIVDALLVTGIVAGTARDSFTVFDAFALAACVMGIYLYYSEREDSLLVDTTGGGVPLLRAPSLFVSDAPGPRASRNGAGDTLHDALLGASPTDTPTSYGCLDPAVPSDRVDSDRNLDEVPQGPVISAPPHALGARYAQRAVAEARAEASRRRASTVSRSRHGSVTSSGRSRRSARSPRSQRSTGSGSNVQ